MAVFKCKMCGADLNVSEGIRIAECEYCGSTQTLPVIDNEKKLNLFNRANHLRRANDFDRAASIYESIIAEFPEEAESYWGLCLCNYGIEYVDDPLTGDKKPTCHRASFDSLQKDENFKLALDYADVSARKVYRDEAREIDRIMEEILSISKNEKPYDVFICYKEKDDNGERTSDSVLAQDVYDALTDKGLKVFFSRITLEDKLGTAYEPYIFAALNSAKVMLVVGTKYEYFNAVWVRNEWSRFLKLMHKDKSKVLIPCFKDIDPYDLPEEFSHLQAQDMSKLGFMQDIIHGIKKIVKTEPEQTTVVKETVVSGGNANTDALLERAFMFLEDGDFARADEFCEQVLNQDPKNANAYLGKLMAELHVRNRDGLKHQAKPFDNNNNYKKAVRFADKELKNTLEGYIKHINTRNENTRIEDIYTHAKNMMFFAKTESEYKEAASLFSSIREYKDSASLAQTCCEKAEAERSEQERKAEIANIQAKKRKKTAIVITSVACVAVCAVIAFVVVLNSVIIPNGKYKDAIALMQDGKYAEAVIQFNALGDFKDAKEKCFEAWAEITQRETLSTGFGHTVALKSDGSVFAVGDNNCQQCAVSDWIDIAAISAGGLHTVALKSDGTVVAVGNDGFGECHTIDWTDIVAISAGANHTVGLKSNGTMVAVGYNFSGQCEVRAWTDIVAISAGGYHTVGLKSDGTVVAVGSDDDGERGVSDWTDIAAISAGEDHTVGLKSDGTVVAVGKNEDGQCNVSDWTDIVAISAGDYHTVGLKSDGTVVAVGSNLNGMCDVEDWTDIVAISAGINHTVGLKSNGTVVTVGSNYSGQCDVSGWKDIKTP